MSGVETAVQPVGGHDGDEASHRRLLSREFVASALYLSLVLLGAVVATPSSRFPEDGEVVRLIFGTALGLLAAHWLAFRLAARITTSQGEWSATAAQEAVAQIAGGLAVAVLASLPYLFFEGLTARRVMLVLLAALPAAAGAAATRMGGRTWTRAAVTGLLVLAVAGTIVAVKVAVNH